VAPDLSWFVRHRMQIETLGDNHAMISAATRPASCRKGTSRRSAWVNGEFADEVILGLLADEWRKSV
jgi:RimJ/RimL family protein N-acetyltransferase